MTIGLSLTDTYRSLTGSEDPSKIAAFKRLFIERADEVMVGLAEIFPEVGPTLASLRGFGLRLGIVSTKNRYMIEGILRRYELASSFDLILGREDVLRSKPDPEGILLALALLSEPPTEVLYVGDSLIDAEVAKRTGLAFVAVLSGTTTAEEFTPYGPQGVLRRLDELPSWLVARGSTG